MSSFIAHNKIFPAFKILELLMFPTIDLSWILSNY